MAAGRAAGGRRLSRAGGTARRASADRPGLRVLVVDDERPARAKLRMLLAADLDVDVVFEAPDGPAALAIIRDQRPDLMFIDIRMPGMDGLSVVGSLDPDTSPRVVFVTAFDDHALHAFELHAVDYLLKPFDPPRFARALARAKDAVATRDAAAEAAALRRVLASMDGTAAAPLDRILADAGGHSVLVKLADVERIESDRNYVTLHAGGRSARARATMAELEARLDPARFARLNRGTIVNLDHVHSLEPAGHGDAHVRLQSGAVVRLSRRYRDRFVAFMGSGARH